MPEWSAEVTVVPELAAQLIREQFADLAVKRVELLGEGWDNTVYLVDQAWIFRFPRREIAVAGIEREIAVLPRLTGLPMAIPTPRFIGERSARYPWPFFGAAYVAGRELADVPMDAVSPQAVGAALGRFLRSLHDPARVRFLEALLPADPMGRADMTQRVERTHERLAELGKMGLWAVPASVTAVLGEARDLPPVAPTAVTHGDLHVRHLLIDGDGSAAGVIDWGDVCRADPAIDLSLYWSALSNEGRELLRDEYGPISAEQLLRARVLSLFLNALLAIYAHTEGRGTLEAAAIAGLQRTMVD